MLIHELSHVTTKSINTENWDNLNFYYESKK